MDVFSTYEQNIRNFRQVLELIYLIPISYPIVSNVESVQFYAGLKSIQLLNKIITEP